jgi:hypothetical protein
MRRWTHGLTVLLIIACMLILSCSSDDGGGSGANPATGVEITPGEAEVEIGHSLELSATVQGGDTQEVSWYVNGDLNGNSVYGTITQNSPVTYSAPMSLPSPDLVVIEAVSDADTTMVDSCLIQLTFTTLHVDAVGGNDATGTGCIGSPLKSLTHALSLAESGMQVLAAPGIYDRANGEVFPLEPGEEVQLVGEDWETCIIKDHSSISYNQTATFSASGSGLRKFTLEMGEPADEDSAWNIALVVRASDVMIDSIRISERGDYSVIRIRGGAVDAVIQNCVFRVDDGNRWGRGFEVVFGEVGTTIRNCTLYGFSECLFFNSLSDALVENCTFEFCGYGVNMCCEGDPDSNPNPDLGGGARGSSGGNSFSDYAEFGILNPTTNTIYAKYNTWENDPPVMDVDYTSTGTGSIVVD